MVPIYLAYIFECLVNRDWHYLNGLGSMALLEEVSLAMGFDGSKVQATSQSLSLLAACGSIKPPLQYHACLYAAMLPTMRMG